MNLIDRKDLFVIKDCYYIKSHIIQESIIIVSYYHLLVYLFPKVVSYTRNFALSL
jgi:hypothetical protein